MPREARPPGGRRGQAVTKSRNLQMRAQVERHQHPRARTHTHTQKHTHTYTHTQTPRPRERGTSSVASSACLRPALAPLSLFPSLPPSLHPSLSLHLSFSLPPSLRPARVRHLELSLSLALSLLHSCHHSPSLPPSGTVRQGARTTNQGPAATAVGAVSVCLWYGAAQRSGQIMCADMTWHGLRWAWRQARRGSSGRVRSSWCTVHLHECTGLGFRVLSLLRT